MHYLMQSTLPILIEPEQLEAHLNDSKLLILDVGSEQEYELNHIPGAVYVSPRELICGIPPATGRLPSQQQLNDLFSRLGITPETHVVCYDNEGGGWAGRMIWTLDAIGHANYSCLNGGIHSWKAEGKPLETTANKPLSTKANVTINPALIVEAEDIMQRLGDADFAVWDARSPAEYKGINVFAQRGGHIPGAINCEWTILMDPSRHLRIRENAADILTDLGLTPDKDIVTHCQTHHRSGFTWLVAKVLGYPRVRSYHGSWSEWGNRSDTPVEL